MSECEKWEFQAKEKKMPDLDTSEFVEITHFINPHVFWLRKRNIVDHEFAAIESEMQQYALRQHEKLVLTRRRNQIDRGARVAVYFVAWKKWLRCDVDVIDAKCERCILWAIDYGFPLQSSIELMVLIENHRLAQKCSDRIMKVAISSVVPWKGVSRSTASVGVVFMNDFTICCNLFASRSIWGYVRVVSDGRLRPSMFYRKSKRNMCSANSQWNRFSLAKSLWEIC